MHPVPTRKRLEEANIYLCAQRLILSQNFGKSTSASIQEQGTTRRRGSDLARMHRALCPTCGACSTCKYNMSPVFRFVACRVIGKDNGCGIADQVWVGVKDIKSGKKRHLGPKATEQRSIVYTSTVMEEARPTR